MGYKIIVTNGYNITTNLQTCREYIKSYKEAGIFVGLKFMPWYKGEEVSK